MFRKSSSRDTCVRLTSTQWRERRSETDQASGWSWATLWPTTSCRMGCLCSNWSAEMCLHLWWVRSWGKSGSILWSVSKTSAYCPPSPPPPLREQIYRFVAFIDRCEQNYAALTIVWKMLSRQNIWVFPIIAPPPQLSGQITYSPPPPPPPPINIP